MKKSLLLLMMVLLLALTSFAQTEHMKFMGIHIDGSLKSFCSKLKKKGFDRDPYETRRKDSRIYIGEFAGHNSKVFVYSDAKSNNVHSVIVNIPSYEEDVALSIYNNLRQMLIEKYSEDVGVKEYKWLNERYADKIREGKLTELKWLYEKRDDDGYDVTYIVLPRPTSDNISNKLGFITINVRKDYSFVYKRTEYNVEISYSDTQNYNLYHGNMQDDL
jgi:hypothetical protein